MRSMRDLRSAFGCMILGAALIGVGTACSDSESPQGDTQQPPMTEPSDMPAERAPGDPAAGAPADSGAAPTPDAGQPGADAGQPGAGAEATTTDFSGGTADAGKEVYGIYCETCHGPTGTGDGPGAAALDPKPRNFVDADFAFDPNGNGQKGEPEDLARVVRDGAAAYGGSPNMVPWGAALSEQQLRDVVAYVQSLAQGGGAS